MLNKMFNEFNELYGYKQQSLDDVDATFNCTKLIRDEVQELECELYRSKDGGFTLDVIKHDAVKEMTDIVYITMQQMSAFGVDIDLALAEVHRSNMSKLLPTLEVAEIEAKKVSKRYPETRIENVDGRFVIRCNETGKVIKPSTYSAANLSFLDVQ